MELAGAEGYRWLIGTDILLPLLKRDPLICAFGLPADKQIHKPRAETAVGLLLNRLLRDLVFTDQDRT